MLFLQIFGEAQHQWSTEKFSSCGPLSAKLFCGLGTNGQLVAFQYILAQFLNGFTPG
jgi:hypothetical protein